MAEHEQLLTQVADKARNTRPWGRPSLPEPIDAATPARAEATLGFSLPPLLVQLHLRTADGGFGLEYGLLPLLDSAPSGEPAAVAQYLARRESGREDPDRSWPEGVLPMSHRGCGMYACVDCRSPRATVLLFGPNPGDPDHAWFLDSPDLTDRLHSWLRGTGWYEEENEDTDLAPWTGFPGPATVARTP